MIAQAVDAARSADVAVVFANDVASEGSDRPSLELPRWQDALIAAVGEANPHTVVVLNTSGAVLMPWIDDVSAVVEAWYPGEQDGAAIAPLLFGDVNPSGHLTETFPASASQGPAKTTDEYPGDGTSVSYDEGILVGYRWYQASGEQPLFPFGYGLSYTTFSYANVTATPQGSGGKRRVRVAFDVTNTGSRSGADVAQVYLGLPVAAGEPPKRLAGFEKVRLAPGETRHVTLSLRPEAHPLSFWDAASGGWSTATGSYAVYVGDSSDAPLGATFQVVARQGS
jgi:beta-glucosidase